MDIEWRDDPNDDKWSTCEDDGSRSPRHLRKVEQRQDPYMYRCSICYILRHELPLESSNDWGCIGICSLHRWMDQVYDQRCDGCWVQSIPVVAFCWSYHALEFVVGIHDVVGIRYVIHSQELGNEGLLIARTVGEGLQRLKVLLGWQRGRKHGEWQ